MKEKSFLIIAASIGSGHMRAAEAVAEALEIEYPGARIKIVDFSAWQVSPATAFMKASYLFLLRFIPNLYDLMYRFTGGKRGGLSMQSLISSVTARDSSAGAPLSAGHDYLYASFPGGSSFVAQGTSFGRIYLHDGDY